MKRTLITLDDIVSLDSLCEAFYRAAKGKRQRPEVIQFEQRLNEQIASIRDGVIKDTVVFGPLRAFSIRDPKPRQIHAPSFPERIIHHAVMAHVAPVLDRALVYDTYACRKGKGPVAAVKRAQHHCRRYPWYVQIDIRGYFASINHDCLLGMLKRRLKGDRELHLLARIVDSYHTSPGTGLPIGALTSQHFANFYLSGFDRVLSENPATGAMVRYMDDIVWWQCSHAQARQSLSEATHWLQDTLRLQVKSPPIIGRSAQGLSFCGHRIKPGSVRLSRRRKARYALCRRQWEQAYDRGDIDALKLQQTYASALGITTSCDAVSWRREQLRRTPLPASVLALTD